MADQHRGTPARIRREFAGRRGALGVLYGVGVLAVALLATAYASRSNPWRSVADVVASVTSYWARWRTLPGVGGFEALGYLGLAVAVLGAGWCWIARPVTRGLAGASAGSTGTPPLERGHPSGGRRSFDGVLDGVPLAWLLASGSTYAGVGLLFAYGPLHGVLRGEWIESLVQTAVLAGIFGGLLVGHHARVREQPGYVESTPRALFVELGVAVTAGGGGLGVGFAFVGELWALQRAVQSLGIPVVASGVALLVATGVGYAVARTGDGSGWHRPTPDHAARSTAAPGATGTESDPGATSDGSRGAASDASRTVVDGLVAAAAAATHLADHLDDRASGEGPPESSDRARPTGREAHRVTNREVDQLRRERRPPPEGPSGTGRPRRRESTESGDAERRRDDRTE